jgi:hypothetical protein
VGHGAQPVRAGSPLTPTDERAGQYESGLSAQQNETAVTPRASQKRLTGVRRRATV